MRQDDEDPYPAEKVGWDSNCLSAGSKDGTQGRQSRDALPVIATARMIEHALD